MLLSVTLPHRQDGNQAGAAENDSAKHSSPRQHGQSPAGRGTLSLDYTAIALSRARFSAAAVANMVAIAVSSACAAELAVGGEWTLVTRRPRAFAQFLPVAAKEEVRLD